MIGSSIPDSNWLRALVSIKVKKFDFFEVFPTCKTR